VTGDRDDGAEAGTGPSGAAGDDRPTNDGQVFDRLPATASGRRVPGRPTRAEVVDWWVERFGLDPSTFDGVTFWEKGAGKVWAFAGDLPADRVDVEGVGMTFLRTRQEHWKPTTTAALRYGRDATRNVIELEPEAAVRFAAGRDGPVEWDGDWGYLIAAHRFAGGLEPIGVGLYLHGELRSVVPKGSREELRPP
jgi:NOL1/NOP2/fmu family ribosome biogenesis protein